MINTYFYLWNMEKTTYSFTISMYEQFDLPIETVSKINQVWLPTVNPEDYPAFIHKLTHLSTDSAQPLNLQIRLLTQEYDWAWVYIQVHFIQLGTHAGLIAAIIEKADFIPSAEKLLLDEVDDIVSITDLYTYELLYVNRAGARLLKNHENENRKCYELMQNLSIPCLFCIDTATQHQGFFEWEDENAHLNCCYSVNQKIINWNNRLVRLSLYKNSDKSKQMKQTTQRKLAIEKTIVDCVRSLISTDDLEEAINIVLKTICAFHKADRAYVFELNNSGELASNTYEWCMPRIKPEIDDFQNIAFKEETSRWYDELINHHPVIINNTESCKDLFPDEYHVMQDWDATSLILVPIFHNNKIIGYYGVDNPHYAADDPTLMSSLSLFIAHEIYQRKMNDELHRLSYTDLLTGLYNRNYYLENLSHIHSQNHPHTLGVVFADINGLKEANDLYGHEYGDGLIRQAASDLLYVFNKFHVYRIGGDEFVVLCQNITESDLHEALLMLTKQSKYRKYSISVGSTWSKQHTDIYQLVKEADQQMYEHKAGYYSKRGKNRRKRD